MHETPKVEEPVYILLLILVPVCLLSLQSKGGTRHDEVDAAVVQMAEKLTGITHMR
jgi:hypothetical protein